MIRFILGCIAVLFLVGLDAQSPIASFEMDCSLADSIGTFSNISTANFPGCECGVEGEAIDVSGIPTLTVDTSISTILGGEFAVSFYFQPLSVSNSMELLTVGSNCSSDSILRVYYLDDMNEVVFDANESILEGISLRGTIATNKCWQHVVISRNSNSFFLYINGELADEIVFNSNIVFNQADPFNIGHGPCSGIISNDFEGLIDDLQFFDQHVEPFKASELSAPFDEILSSDTTIFLGDVIDLIATPNCTNSIAWLPSTGISNTTAFETALEGIESNQYVARFDGDFCISTDTIQVFVIDPADVECEGLLIPNVFTPNGDGLNDDIGILNGFVVEELKQFEIFDRWGEIVFETSNKDDRWDGSFQNKAVNSNFFLYKAVYQCNGQEFVKTGNISVLR